MELHFYLLIVVQQCLVDALSCFRTTERDCLVLRPPAPMHVVRQAVAVGDGEVGPALGCAVALRVVAVVCQGSFRLEEKPNFHI